MGLSIGLSIGKVRGAPFTRSAALLLGYPDGIAASFSDNSLLIKDTVTGANSYNGPLITAGAFNKFTYSRASSASYVGSNGLIQTALSNIPRIHYNPSTLALLGYLHEGARTNPLLRSEEMDNAAWTKQAGTTVTANAGTAPDGAVTADRVQFTAIMTFVSQLVSTESYDSATHTYSVWVKSNTGGNQTFRLTMTHHGVTQYFSTDKTATTAWQRFTFTQAFGAGGLGINPGVASDSGSTIADLLVWGNQVEKAASAASSYIPTTTAAVTRAADSLALANTAFNLVQANGTLYVKNTWDGGTAIDSGNRASISLDDATANERLYIYNNTAVAGAAALDGGVSQASLTDLAVATDVFTKNALAYAVNDFAFVQDGRTAVADASGSLPTTTTLRLGASAALGTVPLLGTIQEFAFIGQRISNAAMQTLTT